MTNILIGMMPFHLQKAVDTCRNDVEGTMKEHFEALVNYDKRFPNVLGVDISNSSAASPHLFECHRIQRLLKEDHDYLNTLLEVQGAATVLELDSIMKAKSDEILSRIGRGKNTNFWSIKHELDSLWGFSISSHLIIE